MTFAPAPHVPPPPGPVPEQRRTPARIAAAAGLLTLTAGAFAYTWAVDPNVGANPYPKCPLKLATGIDCPGCGGLRCVHSLLHGDLFGAADHNVLVLVLLPLMLYFWLRIVLAQAGVSLPELRLPRWVAWAAPAFLVVFTVVRNIPGTPLYWLNSAA